MKRWIWLLALPWCVVHSTSPFTYFCMQYRACEVKSSDQNSCADLAEALNEAHERRVEETRGAQEPEFVPCDSNPNELCGPVVYVHTHKKDPK